MALSVFAQRTNTELPLAELFTYARRFSEAELETLSQPEPARAVLRIRSEAYTAELEIHAELASERDYERADAAEAASQAAGMAALARRCRTVWRVAVVAGAPGAAACAELALAAVLAGVGLGPVLPSDASALFGVRGSHQRLSAAKATLTEDSRLP